MAEITREQFLKTEWRPYPTLPTDCAQAGRVRAVDREKLSLELAREGERVVVAISPSPVFSVLVPGDLVAVSAKGEITLLAPTRAGRSFAEFDFTLQKRWRKFLRTLRAFFEDRDFFEMKTPSLVKCPGTEPSLDVFSTELKIGSRREKFFLPTSPELQLKKLLARGAERVFEIAPCFRNGERTAIHQPEFLMLEWYRAYHDLGDIKQDVVALVRQAADALKVPAPVAVRSYSVAELFRKHCDFDLRPETPRAELEKLAGRLQIDLRAAESIDDCFFLIFLERIEKNLPANELIFVERYPPYQAALARLDHEGWGERFEVYWKGMELANAFHELNDPVQQRARFAEDLEKKRQMGKEEVPLDEEFLESLEAGMPPSAGIALGMERLFMALTDETEITRVRSFSL